MITHYIPPFTEFRQGGLVPCQRAFCGTFVEPVQHSTEPTCERCAELLLADGRSLVVAPVPVTHWSRVDAQTRGRGRYREERAGCGAWVPYGATSVDPTCPTCIARQAEFNALDLGQFEATATAVPR